MTATYDQADITYNSSRWTYNGDADDTVGAHRPPEITARQPKAPTVAEAPKPRASVSHP